MLLTSSGFAPRASRPAFVAFLLGEGQSTTFHAPVRTAVNFDNARQSSVGHVQLSSDYTHVRDIDCMHSLGRIYIYAHTLVGLRFTRCPYVFFAKL